MLIDFNIILLLMMNHHALILVIRNYFRGIDKNKYGKGKKKKKSDNL